MRRLRFWKGVGLTAVAVLAASMLPTPAGAQVRVEGEVIDESTGLPVQGVIVQFPDVGLATLTDSMGYFSFEAVPRGEQIISTYHFAYDPVEAQTPIVVGDVLAINLTPRPISLRGVDVDVRPTEEIEALTIGRAADYISPETIEDQARRTNKLLEVFRAKAPPRLQIRQQGGFGGINFCIQSSRQSPSLQELRDLGTGCRPALIVLDGIVIYAPPSTAELAGMRAHTMPEDVAAMLLNQRPEEIESIRILTPSDAFFRYGDAGRLGAVEVKTQRPNARRR